MYYNNEECLAYKDVIINDKKYTVIIKDIKIEAFDTCSCSYENNVFNIVASVEYLCFMFDNENNLIYNKSIYKREDKKYLDVIKEFCLDYIVAQERINKSLEEERLALKELEEWDGIIK